MLSVLDIFKIGVGPSSSHTMGPMAIALRFVQGLKAEVGLEPVSRIHVELYGSLALTGKGHGTDRATLLGLCGFAPELADPDDCDAALENLRQTKRLIVLGEKEITFDPDVAIDFAGDTILPQHPNAMRLHAFDELGNVLRDEVHFSLGGGFTCRVDEFGIAPGGEQQAGLEVPYPFTSARELLWEAKSAKLSIAELVLKNEDAFRPRAETLAALDQIWSAMSSCMKRGLKTEGILPGGLKVKRRAKQLFEKVSTQGLNEREAVFDWLNAYAMAVNEENAAGGRVVTAPTNGAAGIIPAVVRHYCETEDGSIDRIRNFLLTAGAIGILYKTKASISGAEMGCQGEVGVACSMAAGGLVAAWGGSNEMAEHAAEIGMEHNLGLTCDPVGGLVQVPCIERNAIGAVKAVNAARLSMSSTGGHQVSLDQVIETMRQTGLDMNSRYKETSQGGLAVNVVEC